MLMLAFGYALLFSERARIGVLGDFFIPRSSARLIRSGPYAHLRPIYTGIILATTGTALTIGEWGCVPGVLLVLTGFSLKAMKEENMLTEQFGSAFEEHRKHTGFLIPRFR
jgi:protein-S-isoprenylcysteine O-methyltransferase Ste14